MALRLWYSLRSILGALAMILLIRFFQAFRGKQRSEHVKWTFSVDISLSTCNHHQHHEILAAPNSLQHADVTSRLYNKSSSTSYTFHRDFTGTHVMFWLVRMVRRSSSKWRTRASIIQTVSLTTEQTTILRNCTFRCESFAWFVPFRVFFKQFGC